MTHRREHESNGHGSPAEFHAFQARTQRLHRHSGQWSLGRLSRQKLSHAATELSAAFVGVHASCVEQKPHALQSQRVQWADACFSEQYPLQLSTSPSSCELAWHWAPLVELLGAMMSIGLWVPPQKLRARFTGSWLVIHTARTSLAR